VLNILVPEIVLQRAGVVAIVGQFEAAGMSEHVRMDRKWHVGGLTEALDEVMEANGVDDRHARKRIHRLR